MIQDFSMYRYLQIIYVKIGFLEFCIDQYCENNIMIKLTV
jgi:hypothetical protein